MKTLMIHECTDSHLTHNYMNSVLTFDDGLYTQYKYIEHWNRLPNRCIFFITPTIICNGVQDTSFITAPDAHNVYFETGNAKHYMTIDQIKDSIDLGMEIGIHGWEHVRLSSFGSLMNRRTAMLDIIDKSLKWFKSELNYKPKSYCHPYNDNDIVLDEFIKCKFGLEIFGPERVELIIKDVK